MSWETKDAMRRLRDRVAGLDVRGAIEKVIDGAESEIRAIRPSGEFKLAERTGNANVFNEEMAEIRSRAMRSMEKLAAATSEELDYLEPTFVENAETGSYARLAGEEASA